MRFFLAGALTSSRGAYAVTELWYSSFMVMLMPSLETWRLAHAHDFHDIRRRGTSVRDNNISSSFISVNPISPATHSLYRTVQSLKNNMYMM